MMDSRRRETEQTADAAAAGPHSPAAERAAAANQSTSVAISPFSRLATVELQLIMRCCDQPTLIALARCSRFALAASSSRFVWQPQPPITLQCDWPLELSERLRTATSLLRYADINVTWRLRSKAAASADQAAALAALPWLRGLSVAGAYDHEDEFIRLSNEGAARLFEALRAQIDHGGALTSLSLNCDELRRAGVRALVGFIERSRALTTLKIRYVGSPFAASETLVPLASALAQHRTLTCLEVELDHLEPGAFRTLAAAVQQSSSLTTFRLRGLWCIDESVAALAAAVKQSRSLTDLQLPNCVIGDAEMETLAAAVEQSSSRIRKLDVSNNDVGSDGAASLARLLASDRCALTALDAFENEIGAEGALALAGALQANRTLTELRLGSNNMDSDGTAAVIAALRHNAHCRLRVLDLSGRVISRQAAAALAAVMQRSGTLVRLEVRGCSLTDEAMATLAAGVGHSHSLQHLDVSFNVFGAAGVAALAAAIGSCPALASLNVSFCKIGDAGLAALAPALVNVRSLNLHKCGLTSQSGQSLAELIQHSRALESLNADNNGLGANGVAMMASALQPSSSLRTLHLQSGCGIGADGTAALAVALCRGWRASELHLACDPTIGDHAARALAAALEWLGCRCTLTALTLRGCGLTAAGALALVLRARGTPRLQSLDLSCNEAIKAADRPALIAACGSQPHFELGLRYQSARAPTSEHAEAASSTDSAAHLGASSVICIFVHRTRLDLSDSRPLSAAERAMRLRGRAFAFSLRRQLSLSILLFFFSKLILEPIFLSP
jgi:Ran GTPase-activating protein (RanGAP) involved in mRNA processing and transport